MHSVTSPLISTVIAMELMLNLFGEDSKRANRHSLRISGNLFGVHTTTGGTDSFDKTTA
nr:MAG TPA: hypothetical protein [Caudoviricetes sp.]